MNLLLSRCVIALAAFITSILCSVAHAGFSVPVLVPIEVDTVANPVPVTAPTITGNFTYAVTCTNSQGAASSFTFPSPTALTLTATALATPFSPRPSGNATALQQSGSFQIVDPKDCIVTQLTRPSPPTGYVWDGTPVAPITVSNFSNNETRIAPDSIASFSNTLIPATYSVTGVASPLAGGTVSCASPVTHGNTSACSAAASTGFSFSGITSTCGAASSNASYTTGPVTANCTVTATFTQNTFTVTGVANPLAGGSVSCNSPVNQGSTSTCAATANTGYTFTGITSTCGAASSSANYTTGPVTASCTVTGAFALNTYAVTGLSSPLAGGSVMCSSPVNHGSTSTCTATASTGYSFTGITSTCGPASSSASYTTSPVTANCVVTGNFSLNTYTVAGVASPPAGGSVACASPVNHGSASTCTATANTGYTFTGITSTCGPASSSASYTTSAVTANCVVTGNFSQNAYTVTGVANPLAGGSVACASPVNHGSTSLCTASANTGYTFTGITSTCGAASTSASYTTGAVNANCTVTAAFSLNSYVITTVVSPVGSGTLTCVPNPVTHGTTATCTATPSPGYSITPLSAASGGNKPAASTVTISSISGCGGTPSATSSFTTGVVTAPCTVTASFVLNTFTVTGVANPVAGGNVTCASPVNFNTTSSCSATANVGYTLTGISGCGGTASTTSPYTTGPVTASCTVTAAFSLNSYPITAVASPAAGGNVSCVPNPANFGTTSSCSATANVGYALTGFSGCNGITSATSPYTTGAISAACTVTATFQPLTFPVTMLVVVAGGGTLNCTPNPVTYGAAATCIAVPNAGYLLSGVSGCGGLATTTSPFVTGPMTAACTVTAVFALPLAPAIAVPTLAGWGLLLLILSIGLSASVGSMRRSG